MYAATNIGWGATTCTYTYEVVAGEFNVERRRAMAERCVCERGPLVYAQVRRALHRRCFLAQGLSSRRPSAAPIRCPPPSPQVGAKPARRELKLSYWVRRRPYRKRWW
jgi:hypothetical protein